MLTLILLIIALVLALVLVIIISVWVSKVRRQAKRILKEGFGTEDLEEAFRKSKLEASQTPRTVSDIASLKLPYISRDFPDFNYAEMKSKAENVALTYMRAIDEENAGLLSEGNSELRTKLDNHIGQNKANGRKEHFKELKAHKTGMSEYRTEKGRCVIVFRTSYQAKHYVENEEGKLISGEKDFFEQSVAETELIYIQDRMIAENDLDGSLSLVCPNCGAPITNLGQKFCEYCGTAVQELNIKVWSFSNVKLNDR